jgi:hypothetical protein
MSTIYLVTAGEYSGYHIVCAYADPALAHRHVELDNHCTIEEFDIVETEPKGYVIHHRSAYVHADGTVEACPGQDYSERRVQDRPTPVTVHGGERVEPSRWGIGNPSAFRYLRGQGTNLTRLERAMQDRITKAQAEFVEEATP